MILSELEYCECKIAANRLRRHEAAIKLAKLEGVQFKATQRQALRDKILKHSRQIQRYQNKIDRINAVGRG